MRLSKSALTLFFLTLALSRIAGRAQTTPGTPAPARQAVSTPPTPTLKVYSRETIVDVTVTDAKGNPVHGLKQSDFTIKEDNKPQPISSFHEYSAETAPPPRPLPPNVYTNLKPPPASSAVNFILLDGLNTAPEHTDGRQTWAEFVASQA